jgi:cellulose synthase operon protein C
MTAKSEPRTDPPRFAAALLSLLAVSLPILARGAPQAAGAGLKEARELLAHGRYAEAEQAFARLGKNPEGALGIARIRLETGRAAEAEQAARRVSVGPVGARALTLVGEALWRQGKREEAERVLEGVVAKQRASYRALVLLGIVQKERGREAEAKATFDRFYDDYAAGKIDKGSAEQLTYVAMACRYSDNFRDASDTLADAVKVAPGHVEALVEWAEISLEKYEAGYAEKHYQAALKVNPNHAQALVGLARVKLEQSNDARGALGFLDRAERVAPGLAEAEAVRTEVLLDAEQYAEAEALLARVLARTPAHLEALALLGASRFLRDDAKGYEAVRARVLALSPKSTAFYRTVVKHAVRVHRYAEAIELGRRAIQLDPKDWSSLADLGTNHLRFGDDETGLKYLREAWRGDRFNVRTYNLLNLFEDVLAKEYEFIRSRHFRLRVHRTEKELIQRTVVPLLERAFGIYAKKYQFTPKTPITVELFQEPSQFAVRTVGVPGLAGALGVCFGQVITSMSPLAGRFSWGQVLWHELNHVFTIQLTRSRVPRWLTEGLAEVEPPLERAEWKRENDFDVYRALRAGRLRGLAQMNTAFTQAQSLQEMVVAYHQGSLLAGFIVRTFGLPRVLEALKAYARGKRTDEILPSVTGLSLVELDRRFREGELRRLAGYGRGFFVDWDAYQDLEARRKAAGERKGDAAAQADLAAALFGAGKGDEAAAQVARGLALDPKNRVALLVSAQLALARRDGAAAEKTLRALLGAGGDGYEPRLALGRLLLERGGLDEGALHLAAAKRFDPERDAPYKLLAAAYERAKKEDKLLAELEGLVAIENMDFAPAEKLVDLLHARRDFVGVRRYGVHAYYIQPASVNLHRKLADAWAAAAPTPSLDQAIWHLETALLAASQPADRVDLHVRLARVLLDKKDARRAKEQVAKALAIDPKNQDALSLRARIR